MKPLPLSHFLTVVLHCIFDINGQLYTRHYDKRFNDFDFWCFNATFTNISAILWRPVLVVEEAGVHGENHRPWASNWQALLLAAASRVYPFV